MNDVITYLNTDLDLTSTHALNELANAFRASGDYVLHVTHSDDGYWYAIIETGESFTEPEPNIAAMLTTVESLTPELRSIWNGCTLREFNLGYDCGAEPWAFNHGLSAALIARIVAAGASVRITLYPNRD